MKHNSIEWHEECLKNSKLSEDKMAKRLQDLHEELSDLRSRNSFYDFQIREAKIMKKTSFDQERFRKKSSHKVKEVSHE